MLSIWQNFAGSWATVYLSRNTRVEMPNETQVKALAWANLG